MMRIRKEAYKEKKKKNFTSTQLILLGFLMAILVGTLLLCLPFATAGEEPAPFLTALFTATTSVCVTGLVVVETAAYWSLFGKIVILLLIQCGGLGIISFTTAAMLMFHKKITLKDRILIEEAFNLNNLSGLLKFLRKVFYGTFIVEGIGAIFSAFTLVPEFGVIKGIWFSVFHAISAFCNAGLDIIGADSLIPYRQNVSFNLVTTFLIIAGGLGFPVWFDLMTSIKGTFREKRSLKYGLRRLGLHSKIVLSFTLTLILISTMAIFFLERGNSLTIGKESLPNQLLMSFFQAITLRTAGFCTIPQQNLTNAGTLVSMICMFVGGSPIGTAGGIKTTTAFALVVSAWCLIRGKQQTTVFGRTLSGESIRKALGVMMISFFAVCSALLILLITEKNSFLDLSYEVISASATVGLTRNITPNLSVIGKLTIILCMYLGRIGPISLAIALGKKKDVRGSYQFPTEEIPIG